MSGLFAYFTTKRPARAECVAARMGERMRHHDYYRIDTVSAGCFGALGRIGIGLQSRNPQPACVISRGVTLTLSGEFYHQEPTRLELERAGALAPNAHDVELALQVYLKGGARALAALDGMFTAAVWDDRTGDLWVVNDRFGLYPHYYAHRGGDFVLAPEIKGVLAAPGVPRRLDLVAIAQYTRFQQILGDRTWFEDIHLLSPATILGYRPDEDRLTLTRYWDWDRIPLQPESISLDDAAEETIRIFQRAIDARTQPPLRVGTFLSGGLDGRAILGFASDRVPVSSLTFGAPGCRDVYFAGEVARRAGSDHHWFPMHDGHWVLDHAEEHLNLTEGQHSWIHVHGMNMLSAARQLIDVNLSGWDGGTILGGFMVAHDYDHALRHAPDEERLAERFFEGFCNDFAWPGLTDDEADALFRPPGNPALGGLACESMREELARTAHIASPYRADYFYIRQHCRRSTQNMITFTRSAIEVRCPYFDYDLVSFLYGLPERLRSSLDLQHRVLTLRTPKLARIPHEKDNLPPHSSKALRLAHRAAGKAQRVVNRVKPIFPDRPRLYADYENYLRHELAGWGAGILLDRRTLDRGLFNPAAVRELWERHQRGDQLWTIGKVAQLITLELVLRRFHDEDTGELAGRLIRLTHASIKR